MEITKVLNNNVVMSYNDAKQEIVVMGRGLAFQKREGDRVEQEKIEKVFVTEELSSGRQLQELFAEIPVEEIELSQDIIQYAEAKLKTEFSANIYLTLTDHLHYAIDRTRQGLQVKNPLLLEIKRFYPEEFGVAKEALELVHQRLQLSFPEDEAAFITFHFINGRQDDATMVLTVESIQMVHDMLSIISKHYSTVLDEESLSYTRLVTHLQYFSRRLLTDEQPEDDDDFMYELVKKKYRDAYECTQRIDAYLQKTKQKSLTKSEQTYLIIHIQRVIKT